MKPLSLHSSFYTISESHQNVVRQNFPEAADDWIAGFPETLDTIAARWHLRLEERLEGGIGVNQVYAGQARMDTGPDRKVVVKIGLPNNELSTEIDALTVWNGRQAVRVFRSDKQRGAILLERLLPGQMLKHSASNHEESFTAAHLMKTLPFLASPTDAFPHFDQWITGAFGEFRELAAASAQVFAPWVDRAEACYEELSASGEEDRLLHGDLHHENILFDEDRGWIAIDPKGVIGKPVLETGRFVQNFLRGEDESTLVKEVQERIQVISEMLERDASEILKAALVDLALSYCWTLNNRNRQAADVQGTATAMDEKANKEQKEMADRIRLANIYKALM